MTDCGCGKCEELMQPYLDHALTDAELAEAEQHLDGCSYCGRRYRFEASLRMYVKKTCAEVMDPALKAKLVALRTPLQ